MCYAWTSIAANVYIYLKELCHEIVYFLFILNNSIWVHASLNFTSEDLLFLQF